RARSDTSSDNSNVREEIDELYTEAMHIESHVHTIAALEQQLQEQENRELIMIMEFQRNIEDQEQMILELRRQLEEHDKVIAYLKSLFSEMSKL
ncbi:14100_t:CDS:2, partial [Dentiscutata heterogama]